MSFARASGIPAFISVISKARARETVARIVLSWCRKTNRGQRPQKRRNAATRREEESEIERGRKIEFERERASEKERKRERRTERCTVS